MLAEAVSQTHFGGRPKLKCRGIFFFCWFNASLCSVSNYFQFRGIINMLKNFSVTSQKVRVKGKKKLDLGYYVCYANDV